MKTIAPKKKKELSPDETLIAIIYKYSTINKVSKEELADAMYFSRSTLYNRLRAPGTFSFEELKLLFKTLRVSDDDMANYMTLLTREIIAPELVS